MKAGLKQTTIKLKIKIGDFKELEQVIDVFQRIEQNRIEQNRIEQKSGIASLNIKYKY